MSDVIVFENEKIVINVTVEEETLWLTQKELSELFGVTVATINEHIKNIYKEEELTKDATIRKFLIVRQEGKREVKREIEHYNLDLILSVGYRVKSKIATKFRQWASKILKQYLLDGYALNKDRLQQKKLEELDKTIQLIKQGLENRALNVTEAKGFVEIVSDYAKSWALLQGYDEQSLQEVVEHREQKFVLDYDEALEAIAELKRTLMQKGEATQLFGQEKAGEFKGNLLNIYQTFGGEELLPSIEQKASNLLYYVIKGHPFNDGNKRIGAYLFILFLHKNGILHKANGEPKINDNALASLALLVATSAPEQKEIIIKLVMNMLYEGDL